MRKHFSPFFLDVLRGEINESEDSFREAGGDYGMKGRLIRGDNEQTENSSPLSENMISFRFGENGEEDETRGRKT